MDDELIEVCATAARVACQRMTSQHLKALHESVEHACRPSARFSWERKATAHAEVVSLLAGVAADPVLAAQVKDVPRHLYDLMVTVGPAADGMVLGSRRRLLAMIRAGDAEGAAWEMERHLGVLSFMRRLALASSSRPARSAGANRVATSAQGSNQ